GRWVARDDYVAYLEEYARRRRLRIEFGIEVGRVDREGRGWRLQTSAGPIRAGSVVIATGHDRVPFVPDWPGREEFAGELLHAAAYRNPVPFRGRSVLVVACGNSGADIAADLAAGGAGRVQVSMRTPPNVFPREFLGVPLMASAPLLERLPAPVFDAVGRLTQRTIYGDLTPKGLRPAPLGVQSTMLARGISPVTDDGFVAALRRDRIGIVPEVVRFEGQEAVLRDGRRSRPDAVIAATGYRRGLEPLVGHLGVLDAGGAPAGEAEGLHFIGYRPTLSGQLHGIKGEARSIARTVRRRSG
ncbi:MAG TPA: NAD(P)/FAD-dependent oxidoreductase, partial [Solirubrobacterales bacterium]